MSALRPLVALTVGLVGLCGAPTAVFAQPVPPAVDPASIPDQPWYPPGYRDLLIAAASEVATFPRNLLVVKQGAEYNLTTCDDQHPDRVFDAVEEQARAGLALEVSRIGFELKGLGYPADIYERPLRDYERELLAAAGSGTARSAFEAQLNFEQRHDTALAQLAAELERRRQGAQSGRPIVVQSCPSPPVTINWDGGLPPRVPERGGEDVAIVISPPSGRLWLINGFAFRLCERKQRDPWNHVACGWSEYLTDDGAHLSGRYIYEVRWPDGTVQRGARILEFDPSDRSQVIRFDRD